MTDRSNELATKSYVDGKVSALLRAVTSRFVRRIDLQQDVERAMFLGMKAEKPRFRVKAETRACPEPDE